MGLVDRIVTVESGGNPNAQNTRSSAGGAGQFIDSTWLSMLRQHRPDLAAGKSDADLIALKTDPGLSREMTGAYAGDNAGILSKAGLPVTDGTQYLAHFAGPGGAVGLLNADPTAPAASVLGQRFARANPTMANMSAGDVVAWADRKMGGGSGSAPAAAPMAMAGPAGAADAPSSSPAPSQDQAPAKPQASASTWQAPPVITSDQIAALAAVPQAQAIQQRPLILGRQLAPFSLRG
ncbi:hypothetical protein [Bradyrhizobium sp. OK095]|uniref:hypothetical protein n=1 Tax=Bradyrhizobium sp. OK095 TaxID=1882760 RepID=UPI0008B03F63|nr:hypothetical protein [Bradyrhizobium sp. OK095]SEN66634.1 hypothetical protein SAMN05443254_11015 [Bradyrhizobium sp. OK095]